MSQDNGFSPPFPFAELPAAESPDEISPAPEFDRTELGELAEWLVKNLDNGNLDDSWFSNCPHPGSAAGSVPDQGQGTGGYDSAVVSQQSAQSPMTVLPVSTVYPGPYQFQLEFGKQPKETKSAAWTFSPSLNKLYAQKDAMCPVRFRVDNAMGANLFIRALPIFLRHEYVQEIVRRCPNHVQAPENANVRHKEHFVWCEHPAAQYVAGGSAAAAGRLSVVVPVDQPPAGTPWITYLYSFKCLNSCVGGPNRREMTMIFTLENQGGDILGRQSFDLRICACPGRDRKTDEGKLEGPPSAATASGSSSFLLQPSPQSPSGSPSSATAYLQQPPANAGAHAGPSGASGTGPSAPARRGPSVTEASEATVAKRSRVADDDDDDDDVYNVYVTGRSNFELLCQIRDSLELADRVRPLDRHQYLQRRQYSDGPVDVAADVGGAAADRGRTSFTFSCDSNPVKAEIVDSTQPGSSGSGAGGIDMTDSADVTSTCADEQSATTTIAAWLRAVGFGSYCQHFEALGLDSMERLLNNIRSLDLERLGIPQPHRGQLWQHLLLYRLRVAKRRLVVVPSPGGATVTLSPSAAASRGSTSSLPPLVLRLGSSRSSADAAALAPRDDAPPTGNKN